MKKNLFLLTGLFLFLFFIFPENLAKARHGSGVCESCEKEEPDYLFNCIGILVKEFRNACSCQRFYKDGDKTVYLTDISGVWEKFEFNLPVNLAEEKDVFMCETFAIDKDEKAHVLFESNSRLYYANNVKEGAKRFLEVPIKIGSTEDTLLDINEACLQIDEDGIAHIVVIQHQVGSPVKNLIYGNMTGRDLSQKGIAFKIDNTEPNRLFLGINSFRVDTVKYAVDIEFVEEVDGEQKAEKCLFKRYEKDALGTPWFEENCGHSLHGRLKRSCAIGIVFSEE